MIKHVDLHIENYGVSKFIFYKVPSELRVDFTEADKLKNNKVPGLLPCVVINKGDEAYFRYDLVSEVTLAQSSTDQLTKEQLYSFFTNIIESLIEAERLGLNVNNFVFDENYIFIDNFSNRLILLYMPIKNNIFEKVSIREFFTSFLHSHSYDENDDLTFFVRLHNYFATSEEINLYALQQKLHELLVNKPASPQSFKKLPIQDEEPRTPNYYSPGSESKASEENGVLTSEYSSKRSDKKKSQKLEIEEEVQYKRITRTELGEGNSVLAGGTSINIKPNVGSPISFDTDEPEEEEGTTVLTAYKEPEEEEGTTALGVGTSFHQQSPYLLTATQEKIMVSRKVFKIGRDPQQTDYTSKNKVVGRVHAELITENGEYFIVDKESRNGSYVNGVKLVPKNKVKIKHEDKIKLANEEFEFRLF
ncbi:DUF6382 domain-containing protein [Fredinandcohnia sp. QZ13]|uniref:DUF6382 domain-containing protein n=1 Tax=Fredinandcohnia sp. QZ13 TaxID=3073144 RepID=UPI00285341A7|nr:DUF6382 domain-containing protein [Fredinandcohnia sp. QZ13]MDR4889946.1 DUF6382 domain-containing protein [Fredinandcohnia sp. QZ13]